MKFGGQEEPVRREIFVPSQSKSQAQVLKIGGTEAKLQGVLVLVPANS